MRRHALYALAAALVVVGVATQVALPPIASDRVADRLTQGGGSANASVSAVPAVRLLFGDGDKLTANGTNLDFEPATSDSKGFERLDGFADVSVHITDSKVGPFEIGDLELTRSSPAPYHLVARARTSPHDLLAFGADQLGFVGGLALRFGGDQVLGDDSGSRIPVRLDMDLASEGGRVVVVAGEGTIAGIPTGPLGELITSAIAIRL